MFPNFYILLLRLFPAVGPLQKQTGFGTMHIISLQTIILASHHSHSVEQCISAANALPSWIEFSPKNEKSKKLSDFRVQAGSVPEWRILCKDGLLLLRTFALTSVDLSRPRSRRNVRGQVWLHTSLWPIFSNMHYILQFHPLIWHFCKARAGLTRIVTNFHRRRQPGTWLLTLFTSRFTWWSSKGRLPKKTSVFL